MGQARVWGRRIVARLACPGAESPACLAAAALYPCPCVLVVLAWLCLALRAGGCAARELPPLDADRKLMLLAGLLILLYSLLWQVLAEAGKSKAVAFDEIDKAPEEKARGITIATAHGALVPARQPAKHMRRPAARQGKAWDSLPGASRRGVLRRYLDNCIKLQAPPWFSCLELCRRSGGSRGLRRSSCPAPPGGGHSCHAAEPPLPAIACLRCSLVQWSTRRTSGITRTWTAPATPITSRT